MFADVKLILARPIIPQLICLVLILLVIWQITIGVLNIISLNHGMNTPKNQHVAAKVEGIDDKNDAILAGVNTHFFGDYVPKTLSDAGVKQSMLNLKIVGIMFAKNEKDSHVIIMTAAGKEETFKVGESLPGGAIIKRITADGVLIGHNGVLESLSLPKNVLIFEAPAKPLQISN